MEKLQDLLLDRDIAPKEYGEIKSRYEKEITSLNLKKNDLKHVSSDMEKYLEWAGDLLLNIESFYENGSPTFKKKLLGSMFPEKVFFDGKQGRTTKINEALALTLTNTKALEKGIKKSDVKNDTRFSMVELTVSKSNQFWEDLKVLWGLKKSFG